MIRSASETLHESERSRSAARCPLRPTRCSQTETLFDHLVGAQQERLWDSEAEGFCGGQIDDEVEFGRLLDRNVAWFHPAQNLVRNVTGASKHVWTVSSIGHQTSRFEIIPRAVHRRQPCAERHSVDANPVGRWC